MSWLSSKYGSDAPAECPIDPAVTEKYAIACRAAANETGLLEKLQHPMFSNSSRHSIFMKERKDVLVYFFRHRVPRYVQGHDGTRRS